MQTRLLFVIAGALLAVNTARAQGVDQYACPLSEPAAVAIAEPLGSGGWTTNGAFDDQRAVGIDANRNRMMAPHGAVDVATNVGKPIMAIHAGRVVAAADWPHLGRTVIVEHSPREYSVYGYLGTLDVAEGATIAAGAQLATAGFSGDAVAVHNANPKSLPRVHVALLNRPVSRSRDGADWLRALTTTTDAWLPRMDSIATPLDPVSHTPARCWRPAAR